MRVVLATHNAGKLAELRRILDADPALPDVELLSAADVDVPPADETATTFDGNARIKARAGAVAAGLPCLADDSGLVIDALGGEPGVRSARYAGAHGDDEANLALVLERMDGVADRAARFVCAAALVAPDGREWVEERSVEGVLTTAPRGDGGFGYDPIFVPLGDARTTAEMPPDEKDAISHRGKAFRAIARRLREL